MERGRIFNPADINGNTDSNLSKARISHTTTLAVTSESLLVPTVPKVLQLQQGFRVLLRDETFTCNRPDLETLVQEALKFLHSPSDPAPKIVSCELWHSPTPLQNPPYPGPLHANPLTSE